MQLEKTQVFSKCGDRPLKWPNSAAVFSDGRVAVADGGNHRVCILSPRGEMLWEHGSKGFSKNSLREPIYVGVSPDQYLFVSDWHNHRILVFKPDLGFSHTLFHLGLTHPPRSVKDRFFTIELFFKHLATDEVAASHYFSDVNGHKKADYKLTNFLSGFFYYLKNPKEAALIFCDYKSAVRKVNGIAVSGQNLVITQKANRCVSIYNIQSDGYEGVDLIRHFESYPDGIKFGRLCNLAMGYDRKIYVCDQDNWRIAVFNPDLTFASPLQFRRRDDLPRGPFSCVAIDKHHLAVARSFGFEILDLRNNSCIYEDNTLGETHGISWDPARRLLYYVDRSQSAIVQFKVSELS